MSSNSVTGGIVTYSESLELPVSDLAVLVQLLFENDSLWFLCSQQQDKNRKCPGSFPLPLKETFEKGFLGLNCALCHC